MTRLREQRFGPKLLLKVFGIAFREVPPNSQIAPPDSDR